jgi:adenine-specific DNA-methyltransferase
MANKQKLELTWIGKEKRPRLEPRILLEDQEKSYHAKFKNPPRPLGEGLGEREDLFDNRLIFGDNLLALKALEAEFAGKVKCVFIDPPYNTGSAFTHYDDGLEHSIWLGLMRDRLEIIRRLLSDDGSLWITIDDNEAHYLKVLCDEVFGRRNFISNIVWEKTTSARNDARLFSSDHDHLLVFANDIDRFSFNRIERTESSNRAYKNPDNDPRGSWREIDYKCAKTADERPNLYYPVLHPVTGKEVWPRRERVWAYGQQEHERHVRENLLWWGKTGNYSLPKLKKFQSDVVDGLVPRTLWFAADVDQTRTAKKEMKELFPHDPFMTPKPERLLQRVLHIATNPGDLVLDSFAGSGTTGAVAHKMGRRWIMVELGEHCHTHIIPRLQKVIDGEDQGGISKAVNWQGGGGFRYYRLAPTLIVDDRWGNAIINPAYNAAMLAEALAKLEGFTYAPSETIWWQHGHSSERDFIYVTTQNLSADQLQALSEEVALSPGPSRTSGRGEGASLLLCCSAFHSVTAAQAAERWPNLTLKKIPRMVLARCEWGQDDYSLNVANLPMAKPSPTEPATAAPARKQSRRPPGMGDLFADEGEV